MDEDSAVPDDAAVAAFNGLPLRGKHLKVGYANPQRPVSSLTPSSPQQAPGSHAPTPVATTPSALTAGSNAAVGSGATPTIVVGTQSLAEQRRPASRRRRICQWSVKE